MLICNSLATCWFVRPSPHLNTIRDLSSEHQEIVEALKSLGLHMSAEAVEMALRELYPEGTTGMDQGELVRQVFLLLQKKK